MTELPQFMDESIPIEQQFKAIQRQLTLLALRMDQMQLGNDTATLITHIRNQAAQIGQQHSTIADLHRQLRLANQEIDRLKASTDGGPK